MTSTPGAVENGGNGCQVDPVEINLKPVNHLYFKFSRRRVSSPV
jgi:hypothetical protein